MSTDNYTPAIGAIITLFASLGLWAVIFGGLSALGVF